MYCMFAVIKFSNSLALSFPKASNLMKQYCEGAKEVNVKKIAGLNTTYIHQITILHTLAA